MTTTNQLITDLEAGLEAAKKLAQGAENTAAEEAAAEPAGSMMPGGVDSAPVSTAEPVVAEVEADLKPVEHAAETEGLDLIAKFKEGKTVKEVASLVHAAEGSTAIESIVKAISDIAQGVRI